MTKCDSYKYDEATIKRYERYRAHLCEKYQQKCHTNGCPLARFECYSYQSFRKVLEQAHKSEIKKIAFAMMEEAKKEGYEL